MKLLKIVFILEGEIFQRIIFRNENREERKDNFLYHIILFCINEIMHSTVTEIIQFSGHNLLLLRM